MIARSGMEGRVAVVTGAGRGIGAATAAAFAGGHLTRTAAPLGLSQLHVNDEED